MAIFRTNPVVNDLSCGIMPGLNIPTQALIRLRGALSTNGTGSYAVIPSNSAFDSGSGQNGGFRNATWSFWLRLSGTLAAEAVIWEKGALGNGLGGSWYISSLPGASASNMELLRFSMNNTNYQMQCSLTGALTANVTPYQHFAIVFTDGAVPPVVMYQQGQLISALNEGNRAFAHLGSGSGPMYFGCDSGSGAGPGSFGPFLQDQNALFTSSFSQTDVQTILYNGGCPPDLRGQPNLVYYQQWGYGVSSSVGGVGNFIAQLTGAVSSSSNHGAIAVFDTSSPLC